MKSLVIFMFFFYKMRCIIYFDSSYKNNDSDGSYFRPFIDFSNITDAINNENKAINIGIKNFLVISDPFIFVKQSLTFTMYFLIPIL